MKVRIHIYHTMGSAMGRNSSEDKIDQTNTTSDANNKNGLGTDTRHFYAAHAAVSFKNVRNRFLAWMSFQMAYNTLQAITHDLYALSRIVSYCATIDLKKLEAVCKLTNNGKEIQDIVAVIRKGLGDGMKSAEEIAEIRDALTHLCNMTENLHNQVDVRTSTFSHSNCSLKAKSPYVDRTAACMFARIYTCTCICTCTIQIGNHILLFVRHTYNEAYVVASAFTIALMRSASFSRRTEETYS